MASGGSPERRMIGAASRGNLGRQMEDVMKTLVLWKLWHLLQHL